MSSFIAPQATTVAAFRVAGIAVRTTNAAEADPASARNGPLWDRFFSVSWEHKLPPPGADALGLDGPTDIGEARRRVGDRVALQGNFDPVALHAPAASIVTEVARILAAYGSGSGHVFNLGHGIGQTVPPEHAAAFVEAVQRLSRPYHG